MFQTILMVGARTMEFISIIAFLSNFQKRECFLLPSCSLRDRHMLVPRLLDKIAQPYAMTGLNLLFGGTGLMKKETLSWSYVQPLPQHIGSFKGNVKLNVLKEKLTEIPPVDLADILEELSGEQRLAIFNQLETEHASDTLEEMEPRVQRQLISSIKNERAAELINAMTPAQAADILAILPATDADDILKLINKEDAGKIQHMLDKQDDKIVNFATSDFIKLPPHTTVGYVEVSLRP